MQQAIFKEGEAIYCDLRIHMSKLPVKAVENVHLYTVYS